MSFYRSDFITRKRAIFAILVIIVILFAIYGIKRFFDDYMIISPIQPRTMRLEARKEVKVNKVVSPTPTPRKTSSKSFQLIGKVSSYSTKGCLGCNPHYDEQGNVFYRTASGEVLDDNKMTLAVVPGVLPMGTEVKITNLDNGITIFAKVNDTGGFAKYNRVADLSLALSDYLKVKTDVSTIKIEKL